MPTGDTLQIIAVLCLGAALYLNSRRHYVVAVDEYTWTVRKPFEIKSIGALKRSVSCILTSREVL